MSIQLIVGLGNIGQEYAQTRHNAGWWMLDELAATWGASFREDKKYYAEVAKANTPQGEVWLMKPSTYMNKSGQAVGALANFFKIPVSDLLVLHDELDIPPGQRRFLACAFGHRPSRRPQFGVWFCAQQTQPR
jgi:PTH1 family peptidyl-tRNA hydrolase